MDTRRTVGRGLMLTFAAMLAGSSMSTAAIAAEGGTSEAGRIDGHNTGLKWGACPEDVEGAAQLECATVRVPLDYDKPDGTTIEVMISRLASTNQAERRGVLLLNPGGPGGAGLAQPAELASLGLPTSVSDSYDLIGMDPRGVGHSSPVSCGFTTDQDYPGNIPPYAPDHKAVTEQAKAAKKVADQCAANDPDNRMRHMTTANTARDMDHIREALGEDKISYYGASYGSGLGGAYASLFAERSDRIVLDSNLGTSTAPDQEAQRRYGLGMEQRFPDFAQWAAQRHAGYGLGQTPGEVREKYFALAERLDHEPVADIDGALFRFSTFAALYSDTNFGQLAQLWQSLAESDAEASRVLAAKLQAAVPNTPTANADQEPQAASLSPFDNTWSSFLAVTCNDTNWPEDLRSYQRAVDSDRARFPLYGAASANVSPCAYWHNDPLETPVEITDEGPDNVLVLQNLRDPVTPHAGGRLARDAFGERARLVSVDEGNHGVYVYDDNPCALNTTTNFLVDGTLPASDVSCPASNASGLKLDRAAEQKRTETLDRLNR